MPKAVSKDEVLGKLVVDMEGKIVGKAVDLLIDERGNVNIVVEVKVRRGRREEPIKKEVPYDYVSAVGDVILLNRVVRVIRRVG